MKEKRSWVAQANRAHVGILAVLVLLVSILGIVAIAATGDRASARADANATDNLESGVPGRYDVILDREGFAAGFIHSKHQPAWVSYRLTIDEVTNKVVRRTNNFTPDPLIPATTAYPADYVRTGYDRGHLAPAADMAWSTNAMNNSFYMSNMSPQAARFNRGIWKDLEEFVRYTAIKEGSILVVTGPIFVNGKAIPELIGQTKVEVPIGFYKVLATETEPRKAIGFMLLNEGSDRQLSDFAVPVRFIEAITGLDFYGSLPTGIQDGMEQSFDPKQWGFQENERKK